MAFGKLHLLILHFPVALILAAGVADVLRLIARHRVFKAASLYCVVLAALTAIPTVITGDVLLDSREYAGDAARLAETHETFGFVTLALVLLTAGLRLALKDELRGAWAIGYAAIMVCSVVSVVLAGHYGGLLAFGAGYWGLS